ncbi:helix-turn-helix domain-containing protein [Haloplanus halophilus]|uniref:helix-turn-helix domain-containing protein n=1 Tax=Haloplanus halophilus TaxID=2949993 RepID=UPI00203EBD32|nr:helix-turn-helix domain-containing protein [Haloplanus sp. GDY1]
MGLVAEYELPCEGLPLVDVAAAVPNATLEVEIQFNHGDRPPFLVHATHESPSAVERALASSPFVDRYVRVGRAGETCRYKVRPAVGMEAQLGAHLDDLDDLRALARADAIVERIRVTPTGWTQSTWFADRAAFDEFRRFWTRNDGFRLRRLTRDGDPEAPGDGLTDPQREALRAAYGMGYFEIPRDASLDDVAAELGITASALSERLRRAQTHLVETTVAPTWPPLPDKGRHD